MYNGIRRLLAAILCAAMLMTSIGIPAFAEETDNPPAVEVTAEPTAAPTEKPTAVPTEAPTPAPVPFEMETTVDGVKFTVTADAGVFANGASLSISKTGSGELTQAAEAVLGIAANETTIIRHAVYSVSGAEMNGSVRLVLDRLGSSALQQQYPDGALSVYVLRHAPQEQRAEDRAKRVSADVNLEQNKLSFSLSELGLYYARKSRA